MIGYVALLAVFVVPMVHSTAVPTGLPTTRSPTTKAPTRVPTTKSPTIAPTAKPTKSPSTETPTESPTVSVAPTTAAPTKTPTIISLPSLIYNGIDACQDLGFFYSYLVFMYFSLGLGPFYIVGWFVMMYMYPNMTTFRLRLKCRVMMVMLIPYAVWILNVVITVLAPSSCTGQAFELTLILLSLLVTLVAIMYSLIPRTRDWDKLTERGAVGSVVIAAAAKEFLDSMKNRPLISIRQIDGGFEGTLKCGSIKQEDVLVQPFTVTATGASRDDVTEELYFKANAYLSVLPSYRGVATEMISRPDSIVITRPATGPTGEQRMCDHFIHNARQQNLVRVDSEFHNRFSCPPTKTDCSFTLEKGLSTIARAANGGGIFVSDTYADPGRPSPDAVFSCANMRKAMPYLLHGYAPTAHTDSV
jgi:hypothetical protein